MKTFAWENDRTLVVTVQSDNRLADGELVTPQIVKHSFDEMMRWKAPHRPGTAFNQHVGTRCEVSGDDTVTFHFPVPDSLALGKLRAMHVMRSRFWDEIGFGYTRNGTGEGHW